MRCRTNQGSTIAIDALPNSDAAVAVRYSGSVVLEVTIRVCNLDAASRSRALQIGPRRTSLLPGPGWPVGSTCCQDRRGEDQSTCGRVRRPDLAAESSFWAGDGDGTVDATDKDDWQMVRVDGRSRVGVQLAPDDVPPDWPEGSPQHIDLDLWVEDFEAAHQRVMGLGARASSRARLVRTRPMTFRSTPTRPVTRSACAGTSRVSGAAPGSASLGEPDRHGIADWLPSTLRKSALTGSLCVPSPSAINEVSNGWPSRCRRP